MWLAALVLSALIGRLTHIGIGNGIFLAGVAAVLASLIDIRFGGERTRVGRDLDGRPLWGIDAQKRRRELRRGLGVLLVGAALWGVLLVAILLHFTL